MSASKPGCEKYCDRGDCRPGRHGARNRAGGMISRPVGDTDRGDWGRLAASDVSVAHPARGTTRRNRLDGPCRRSISLREFIAAGQYGRRARSERVAKEQHAAALTGARACVPGCHWRHGRPAFRCPQPRWKTTPRVLSASAARTGDQASLAANAAAAANQAVRSVVSSTEGLSVSIGKIGHQVENSARTASRAAAEVGNADAAVRALAEDVRQIGDGGGVDRPASLARPICWR